MNSIQPNEPCVSFSVFCHRCGVSTQWLSDDPSQALCELEQNSIPVQCHQCDHQLEIEPSEVSGLVDALESHQSITVDSSELAHKHQMRQQAIAGATQLNWLEQAQLQGT